MSENVINPPTKTRRNHKKQTLWQIWVPLIVGILIVLFLAVLIVILTSRDVSGEFNIKWASISAIYLSLPAIFIAFIFLTILAGLIYLFSKLHRIVPDYMQKALAILINIRNAIQSASDSVAKPVITVKSKWKGITTLFTKKSNRMRTTS